MEATGKLTIPRTALLAAGVVVCAAGTMMNLEIVRWLGTGCLAADGLLWLQGLSELKRDRDRIRAQLEAERRSALLREDTVRAEVRAECRDEMENYRSTLSHGLRMPIAVIQGYADLLRGDMVPEKSDQMAYLDKIAQRSRLMADLLARKRAPGGEVDEGRLELDPQNLIALVEDICADIRGYAAEQGIAIQVLHSQEVLAAQVDKYLLSRIMYNLLENAVKYMGRAGTVTVRVWQQNGQAIIHVQDDGLGIPSAEVERIFDLHYQGSNGLGGQGHGLYLVKKAVEAHHGRITARSAPGRGMGVRIFLPLNGEELPKTVRNETMIET